MFLILPLGLRGLPIRIPYLTISLIVVTCYAYFIQDNTKRVLPKNLSPQNNYYFEFSEVHRSVFLAVCNQLKSKDKILRDSNCGKFSAYYESQLVNSKKGLTSKEVRKKNQIAKKELKLSDKFNRSYSKVANNYIDVIYGKSTLLKNEQIFAELETKKNKYHKKVKDFHKKNNIFSGLNKDIQSAFITMFRHGSLSHLIGNMIFLFFLGIYLEGVFGIISFLTFYFSSGVIAAYGWSLFSSLPIASLVGASGAISGMMGIFFITFYKHEIRMLATILIESKIFYMPVKLSIPIFFVAQDLASAIFTNNNVANSAHLIGFLAGMAISYLLVKRQRYPFIYPSEYKDFISLNKKNSIEKVYPLINNLLAVNPNNYQVRDHFIQKSISNIYTKNKISKNIKLFLRNNLDISLAMAYKRHDKKTALLILTKIPLSMKFQVYLRRSGQMTILSYAVSLLKKNEYLTALRLYDLFLMRFPLSYHKEDVVKTAHSIIEYMIINYIDLNRLERYYQLNKKSLTLSYYKETIYYNGNKAA